MATIVRADACRQKFICTGIKLKPEAARAAPSFRMFRLAALALAGSLAVTPVLAGEYSIFEQIEVTSAIPGCHSTALLHRPASWQPDEAAMVLLALAPRPDAVRDSFVAELLFERVAVLKRVPAPCDAAPEQDGGLAGGMRRARDVLAGYAGPAVAVGYGPGSGAVLGVLREPAIALQGGTGARYSAAVSIGDGAPAFMLRAGQQTGEQTGVLAPLCRALSTVSASMGATPQRDAASVVAEACMAGMANLASVVAGATR